MDLTVYFVGFNRTDALQTMPFDSYDSANDYRLDQEEKSELKIYAATAVVDTEHLTEV